MWNCIDIALYKTTLTLTKSAHEFSFTKDSAMGQFSLLDFCTFSPYVRFCLQDCIEMYRF